MTTEELARNFSPYRIFLQSYLGLSAGSKLLIRCPNEDAAESQAFSELVRIARLENIDVSVELLHGGQAFDGDALFTQDVVLYIAKNGSPHKRDVLEYLRLSATKTKFYRAFDLSNELFELCFNVSQEKLSVLNAAVIAAGRKSSKIHITSAAGTDLVIRPDNSADWVSSFGLFDGRFPGVLPPGEVNTFSSEVSGRIVANGALNTSFAFDDDVRLSNTPISLSVSRGKIESFDVQDPVLRHLCERLFSIENGNRIGEIGFGTNEGIDRFVPFRSHINERMAGFHVGCGSPIQRAGKTPWTSNIHVDFILSDSRIFFDDALVFENHQWIEAALPRPLDGLAADLYADAV